MQVILHTLLFCTGMCAYMWVQCVGVHSVRDVYKPMCTGKPRVAVASLVVLTEQRAY